MSVHSIYDGQKERTRKQFCNSYLVSLQNICSLAVNDERLGARLGRLAMHEWHCCPMSTVAVFSMKFASMMTEIGTKNEKCRLFYEKKEESFFHRRFHGIDVEFGENHLNSIDFHNLSL
jgi:hypothetical protein